MLAQPVIYDGQQQRKLQQGDTLLQGQFDAANATVGASTILAAMIASGFLNRTGVAGAGFNDTTDTAANILAALVNQNNNGVQPGTSFLFRYKNNGTTQTATLVGGTGVTLVGTMTIANNAWRDFLVTVQSSMPLQIIGTCVTVNTSAVVTGITGYAAAGLLPGIQANTVLQTALLQPGMLVTGAGIPASTTILSIQPGVGVTLSAAATATSAPYVALTFSPTITISNEGGGTL